MLENLKDRFNDSLLTLFKQRPKADWTWAADDAQHNWGWNRDNALALATCSTVCYFSETVVRAELNAARGFQDVIFFSGRGPGVDTRALLAIREKVAVLAFRGTEPANVVNWITDARAHQTGFAARFEHADWGSVHEGFASALAAVLEQIRSQLPKREDRRLLIAGHSLGGALAVLAAAVLSDAPECAIGGVYTFGQPRVGDRVFCEKYSERLGARTFRCVNNRDIVPRLPPQSLSGSLQRIVRGVSNAFAEGASHASPAGATGIEYAHAGQLQLLKPGEHGPVSVSTDETDERLLDPALPAGPQTKETLLAAIKNAPKLLTEHVPIGFAKDGYLDRIAGIVG